MELEVFGAKSRGHPAFNLYTWRGWTDKELEREIKTTWKFCIGGFHAISGDANNNGEMNKCWWTNKAS